MKLPLAQRVAYGVSDMGASLTFVAINTWLLYALVNVAGVPPLWAGAVFVAGRLVDAFTDPVMGVLGDRWRDRVGRLPFLRWGAVPLGAAFAAVWWAPDLGPGRRGRLRPGHLRRSSASPTRWSRCRRWR